MIALKDLFLEVNKTQYTIYCDMDGVLCDFNKRFEFYTDMSFDDYKAKYGKKKGYDIINQAGENYWTNMGWEPNGKELWNIIKQHNPYILSSPGYFVGAKEGKLNWTKKHLGILQNRVIFKQAEEKKQESGKNHILIDDLPSNIQDWKSAGGIGILHSSSNPERTYKKLEELGLYERNSVKERI